MAILTTNISSVSLTVSGNTQRNTNISWTCPTVPSGATISACRLTGTATASMRKGSATIKVNGTTVTSGIQFTINLGTNNTTSSVAATVRGGNKNAAGTVVFDNLTYSVEYSIPLPTYTVTFVDYDGTVLKTQTVEEGSSATAPANPSRTGYTFTGWDKAFTNVTSNLTVTAQYVAIPVYTVTFLDYDGTILKTEEVLGGGSATAPTNPARDGYEFSGWDKSFSNVTSDLTITAQYAKITSDILKVKENGDWVHIKKVYQKIGGTWTDTTGSYDTVFDTTFKYVKENIVPTAILYEDGMLLLSSAQFTDNAHGSIIKSYTNWIDGLGVSGSPWTAESAQIKFVSAINYIKCSTSLFRMFNECTSLTSVDLSNFDTSNVQTISYMFNGCTSLTSVDLSSFDMTNIERYNATSMFSGCTNPNLVIYVKDEATKTKIESSPNFPSTATVIIGKPN